MSALTVSRLHPRPSLPERSVAPQRPAHDFAPDEVRRAFARFPSGVAALCAVVDGAPVGMVASSFTVGVSFSPPMVMFAVQRASTTWPRLRTAARIGVSVLGQDQSAVCLQLASRAGDRFAGLPVATTADGAILLDDAAMGLVCTVHSITPAGDHDVVVLAVHDLFVAEEREPLVYHGRAFHGLRPVA